MPVPMLGPPHHISPHAGLAVAVPRGMEVRMMMGGAGCNGPYLGRTETI